MHAVVKLTQINEWTSAKVSRPDALRQSLAQGSMLHAHRLINALHPAEITALLESLPVAKREVVWGFIDPALASGVSLTTFTDCIGFASLLGLATLFLR